MYSNNIPSSSHNRVELQVVGRDWTERLNSVIRTAPQGAIICTYHPGCQAGRKMALDFGRSDLSFTVAKLH